MDKLFGETYSTILKELQEVGKFVDADGSLMALRNFVEAHSKEKNDLSLDNLLNLGGAPEINSLGAHFRGVMGHYLGDVCVDYEIDEEATEAIFDCYYHHIDVLISLVGALSGAVPNYRHTRIHTALLVVLGALVNRYNLEEVKETDESRELCKQLERDITRLGVFSYQFVLLPSLLSSEKRRGLEDETKLGKYHKKLLEMIDKVAETQPASMPLPYKGPEWRNYGISPQGASNMLALWRGLNKAWQWYVTVYTPFLRKTEERQAQMLEGTDTTRRYTLDLQERAQGPRAADFGWVREQDR